MADELYYDDGTLDRARGALVGGLDVDWDYAADIVAALLNGGLLIRERSKEVIPDVGHLRED
jgi:hypothetical protein